MPSSEKQLTLMKTNFLIRMVSRFNLGHSQWRAEGGGGGRTGRRPHTFKVGGHQKSKIKKVTFY